MFAISIRRFSLFAPVPFFCKNKVKPLFRNDEQMFSLQFFKTKSTALHAKSIMRPTSSDVNVIYRLRRTEVFNSREYSRFRKFGVRECRWRLAGLNLILITSPRANPLSGVRVLVCLSVDKGAKGEVIIFSIKQRFGLSIDRAAPKLSVHFLCARKSFAASLRSLCKRTEPRNFAAALSKIGLKFYRDFELGQLRLSGATPIQGILIFSDFMRPWRKVRTPRNFASILIHEQ
jgi:hypothetical protein